MNQLNEEKASRERTKLFPIVISLLLLSLVLFTGCSADQSATNSIQRAPAVPASERGNLDYKADSGAGFSSSISSSLEREEYVRKIIKYASIGQKVTDLEPAIQALHKLVDQGNGFIQSSEIRVYSELNREASYIIRVPQKNYSSILEQIQGIGKNTSISQRGDDVTEEYYDNEARIENLKLQEEAVQKLYDRADKMEDILKITQELFQIRENIERLEGRNRYIDNLASMSTIEVTLREVKPIEYVRDQEDSAWSRAKEGFLDSLEGVNRFFVNLLVFLISSLPVIILVLLPLALLIWWGVRLERRKRIKANAEKQVSEVEIEDEQKNEGNKQ